MAFGDYPALMDPRTMGILSAAFAGLNASGPQRMPTSLGQVIGQGGQAGLGTYMGALDAERKNAQTQAIVELEKQKLLQAQAQFEMQQNILKGVGLVPGGQGQPLPSMGGNPQAPTAQAPGAPVAAPSGNPNFPFNISQIAAMKLGGLPDLTAAYQAANPPGIAARPGAPIVDPRTGRIIANPAPVPTPGIAYIPDPSNPAGWKAVPVPQAAQAAAAQEEAIAGGRAAGAAPYKLGTVNTEGAPSLMTEQQMIEAATGRPMPRPGMAPQLPAGQAIQGNAPNMGAAMQQFAQGGGQPRTVEISPPKTPGLRLQDQSQAAANTEAGKEFISEMRKNYGLLRDVPATLANIDRAKELAAGEAKKFMGPVGEWKLEATKFLRANVPGMEGLQTPAVTGAEEVRSAMFNQVMDNLKKMDAQPSQYQQMVMQDAFGKLGTDPESLPKMLDVFGDILRNRVAIHNETVDSAEKRGTSFPYEVRVKLPEKTAAPVSKPSMKPAGTGKIKFLGFE